MDLENQSSEIKVGIIHSWSDQNRGDSGILFGMLNYLNTTLKPSEVYLFPIPHDNYRESIYDLQKYEDRYHFAIKTPFPPFELYNQNSPKLIKFINLVLNLIKQKLILLNPKAFHFLFSKNERLAFEALKTTSVVLSKGGHIFHVSSWFNNLRIMRDSFPIFLAKKMNKKVVIASQSFGPFKTRYSEAVMKKILLASECVMCREQVSIDILNKICRKNNVIFFPDFAFNITGSDNQQSSGKLKDAIGITVRQHLFNKSSEEEYIEAISELVNTLISKGERVAIIPHCIGPTDMENDIIISKKLFQKLSIKHRESITYYHEAETLDAPNLMRAYGNLKLMVGTRFHSVIFALNEGVPSFAISYSGPKANIMDDFGLKDFMLNIDTLYLERENFIDKVLFMLLNLDELKVRVKEGVKSQKAYFEESVF